MRSAQRQDIYVALGAVVLGVFFLTSSPVQADRIDDLRDEINNKQDQVEELSEEIAEYQAQLNEIGAERETLENKISELELSRKKLSADINATEVEIEGAELTIEQITLEIQERQENINLNNNAIGATIRRINESESQTLVEQMLGYENLSDFWENSDNLSQFQVALTGDLEKLHDLKQELELRREDLRVEREELNNLQQDLVGKRAVVAATENEQNQLLSETQSEEAQYQAILNEKIRLRDQFLNELRSIEEELRIEVDPSSIPSTGSGVLTWPLDNVRVTQYFGNTPFASANPQVYRGAGHNGVDFGAPRGTRIKAALAGTVWAAGNTDAVSGCYSYGKWILLRHNNGLATLYAHLDVINVSEGQLVSTGETIGYSGNTGYSTGPHLHFTVYASDGVQVRTFSNSINCKNAVIPIAPQEAYLNPLSYL